MYLKLYISLPPSLPPSSSLSFLFLGKLTAFIALGQSSVESRGLNRDTSARPEVNSSSRTFIKYISETFEEFILFRDFSSMSSIMISMQTTPVPSFKMLSFEQVLIVCLYFHSLLSFKILLYDHQMTIILHVLIMILKFRCGQILR